MKYVAAIGERGEWSSYRKGWDKHQKADTKAKSGKNTALWRAREAEEDRWPSFNPTFLRCSPQLQSTLWLRR